MKGQCARRLLLVLAVMASMLLHSPPAPAQAPIVGTPIPDVTETITPESSPTATSTPDTTATVTAGPTTPAESEATPTATEQTLAPAEASPSATPQSGVVDNGDGSYTITANPDDVVDLDLTSLLPSGGISFQQIVSLSATLLDVEGDCDEFSPVFSLDNGPDSLNQGILVELGDPNNEFACSLGPTGNLMQSGSRFAQYHTNESGGPERGYGFDYATAVEVLQGSVLTHMVLRLSPTPVEPRISITVADIAISLAPLADLTVAVQLCQTNDADALARQVDYTLDAFGPAAAPDCTMLDPTGIPIFTDVLDANGEVAGTFDSTAQSDGTISPAVIVGSAGSIRFGEGVYYTSSDALAIPEGGGANAGITIYVPGPLGSIALRNVNAITGNGVWGAVFALYPNATCTGTPNTTANSDKGGNLLFTTVPAGTFCISNTTPASGYPLLAQISNIEVGPGEAVDLGTFNTDPPLAPVIVNMVDTDTLQPVPGACAALYRSLGDPTKPPSGLVAPEACDTDGDGSITFSAPLDVEFEVYAIPPVTYLAYTYGSGVITPDDLAHGITVEQDLTNGNNGAVLTVISQTCPTSDPVDAGTVITVEGDGATPIATAGCTTLDASFSFAPFGADSGYAPMVVTTSGGVGTLSGLPWTGSIVFPAIPNTLHAIVDDLRPGASGVSATFEFPDDGLLSIAITVYALPSTPTPTATATPTAALSPTPATISTPTPASAGAVVALPNTGSGTGREANGWRYATLLMLALPALWVAGRRKARRVR
jgi:hypothetical protein